MGVLAAVSVFCDNSLGWEPNDKLFDVAFDWQKIRENVKRFLFVHSDNDPYVPLAKAQFVANRCGGELLVIKGQGHFNLEQSPDYERFDRLLHELKEGHFV